MSGRVVLALAVCLLPLAAAGQTVPAGTTTTTAPASSFSTTQTIPIDPPVIRDLRAHRR